MRARTLFSSLLIIVVAAGCGSLRRQSAPASAGEPAAGDANAVADAPRQIPPPSIALVLGGGGARGFAHIGVLRVLDEARIPLRLVVGTSVGSLIGAMYASDPNTFELEWKAFQIQKEDLFDFSFFAAATGPVKGEAIQKFVRENVKIPLIEKFPLPYIAVATDLNTGQRVEFTKGSIVDAVRASVSIPGVFTPARIGDRTLVDGGVVANLAVDVARAHGADIVIASDITQQVTDYGVTDVVSIIMQSINIMMSQMAKSQLVGADVVIAPRIGDVSTLDFTQKKRCMSEGITAARAAVPAIRAAIARYYAARGGVPPPELAGSTATAVSAPAPVGAARAEPPAAAPAP